MHQVEELFNDNNAHHIHQRLLKLLAPEVDTRSWYDFTALAMHHLPALASRGRPAREEIDRSFVGRLGFTSWSAYLTTEPKAGGLGWTTTGWKRYKEAYALAQAHPWVLELGLKPDQVRVLQRTYGDDWPKSADEHRLYQASEAQEREEREAAKAAERERLKQAAKRLPELERELQELRDRLTGAEAKAMTADRLEGELRQTAAALTQAQAQIHTLAERLGQTQAQADHADQRLADANHSLSTKDQEIEALQGRLTRGSAQLQQTQAQLKQLQQLSWWDHLKAAFRSMRSKP